MAGRTEEPKELLVTCRKLSEHAGAQVWQRSSPRPHQMPLSGAATAMMGEEEQPWAETSWVW